VAVRIYAQQDDVGGKVSAIERSAHI